MDLSSRMDEAVVIAQEAGHILLQYVDPERMEARPKGDRDILTAADLASEEFVVKRLRERFPHDGIVAEEGSHQRDEGAGTWYIDPLDGTVNYSRALPLWCVSLALYREGSPVLGVIHDPLRGETFRAAQGAGAFCNDRPIKCSKVTELADAFVHITVDFHDASVQVGLDDMVAIAPKVMRTRNFGSAALSLAYVAAGRLDAVIHRWAYAWDYGAGIALIREAGGQATQLSGAPYSVESETILATANPTLSAEIRRILGEPSTARLQ